MLSAIYHGLAKSRPINELRSWFKSSGVFYIHFLLGSLLIFQSAFADNASSNYQPQRFQFDFPLQALHLSLEQLAKTTKLNIVYRSNIVAKLSSPKLSGFYTITEALDLLLRDTQLEYQFSDFNHVAIRPKNLPAATLRKELPASEKPMAQEPYIPETLVVGETHYKTCCRNSVSAATKTVVPSIEVPRSLEGIDSSLFTDRGNALLNEAFRDYTSVLVLDEQGNVNLRGFNVPSSAVLVDGMPTVSRQIMASPLQYISGIEVAKGVNSALYGYGEPGGLINLVTKKPTPQRFTHLSLSYGNYDHYIAIDSNSPISTVPGLLQRFNGIVRKEVDYGTYDGEAQQIQLYPYFRYEISPGSRLDISFHYEEQKLEGRLGKRSVAGENFLQNLYPDIFATAADLTFFPTSGPDDKQPKEATVFGVHASLNIAINEQWQQNFSLAYSQAFEDSNYRANWNSFAHFLFDPRAGIPYALMKYVYSANKITAAGNTFLINQYEDYLAATYPTLTPANTSNGEWLDVILDNGNGIPYWTDQQFHFYQQVLEDDNESNLFNGQWNITGALTGFGVKHNLLFGLSYQDQNDKNRTDQKYSKSLRSLGKQYEANGDYVLGWTLQRYSLIPWYNPMGEPTSGDIVLPDGIANSIGAAPAQEYALDGTDHYFKEDLKTRTYGIYLQDLLELGDNWRLLMSGGWYQFKRQRYFFSLNRYAWISGVNLPVETNDEAIDNAFAPTAGLVYLPKDSVALYVNYGKQFNIRTDRKSDLSIFDPERTTMYEAGGKWWLNTELSLMLSYFVLTKENWAVADENALNFLSQDGRLRSEGFEINFSGFLTPHVKITSNYNKHSLRALSDKGNTELYLLDANEGVPDKTGSLWLQFYTQAYGQHGWSIGLGESYIGKREINHRVTQITIDRAILYDALVAYQTPNYRASLNIDNLLNEEWYTGKRSDPTNTIFFASPNIYQGFGRRYRANIQWFF